MPLGMLGKYERLDILGHGVSGIVYLAKDTLLNKQVALKEVDVQAGDARRFLEEARVMDRLRHPNIVRVNGVDRIDGKIVIDMEYVRGQNLQEMLRVEGRLPVDRALDVAIQTLDALDYAHQMQTVHRDIKPANILVARDGTVKLVDFGLAEILATNAYAGGAGTYAYMAPEDFAEEDHSDSLSDIWAVGVTLYEIATGHRPFQVTRMKDPFAWKRALETEAPTPLQEYLADAPPALQTVLDRALARDKRDRYPTAGEFRDDLMRLRAGESLSPKTRSIVSEMAQRWLPPPAEAESAGDAEAVVSVPERPRGDLGVVVADVNAEAARSARRARLPFLARKATEARLTIAPASLDFGMLRKGDSRSVKVQARTRGVEGKIGGRVAHTPGWITAHPAAFDRARQTLTLTAHSAQVWETGDFQETVRVETAAGTAEIPVRLTVLKPRPSFLQIAPWYVPLFAAALFPAMAVALGGSRGAFAAQASSLVPSAAVATGLLSLMLLLIGVAAEIGLAERIACGVLMAVMCFVLGVAAAQSHVRMQPALLTGGLIGAALLLQLLYRSRWKLWACALAGLGLLIGGTFLRYLGHFPV